MIKRTIALFSILAAPVFADPATVEHVTFKKSGDTFTFTVTLKHTDTGWDDYADAWRIKDADGNVLGERKLAHPHVEEQPFTRSLSGVKISPDIDTVWVDAHDTVNGWASGDTKVSLR
ncbi:hypothetical protein ABMC88_03785 [Sulfitobacter sp. HNIBRBA2951]|uniref:hypothetical protein n=1 Tax=Sulfitobacter aquimarinus TaxID=3158557 RepID=UPI0032E0514D